ncbi:MAG: segregation/condensation protein A [Synergistaceae bacterium]|nr:segregation/condensation protein A [Synergistaceae bacterium]
MTYKIKLDIFEGPFDLLVYLIENAQMSIYDIQVSEITSQYVAYIEKARMLDVALASEFMVLAASLIEIKSKMLLPRMKIDDEGNMEFDDPRSELASRLLEYKRFKNAAELLEKCEEEARMVFEKPREDVSGYTDEPDIYLSLDIKQFIKAFNQFLHRKKRIEEIHNNYAAVEESKLTTEEKIDFIRKIFKVRKKRTVGFRDLILSHNDKYEVAVTFTSILEMARQRMVRLRQPVPFGEIKITEMENKDGE